MFCQHLKQQWEWQHWWFAPGVVRTSPDLPRTLRCLNCQEFLAMGTSFDPDPVPWETTAIDVGEALAHGASVGDVMNGLEALAPDAVDLAAFWSGFNHTCGMSPTASELSTNWDALGVPYSLEAIDARDRAVAYAAGSLAAAILHDRVSRCATGNVLSAGAAA